MYIKYECMDVNPSPGYMRSLIRRCAQAERERDALADSLRDALVAGLGALGPSRPPATDQEAKGESGE